MRQLTLLSILFLVLIAMQGFAQNQLKRNDLKSGEITYETTTSGKMMGSTISGSGTEKLYFKDWGAIELRETEATQTTEVKFFGKKDTETEVTHKILKLDNGKTYSVDFEKEIIFENRDMAMDMTMQHHPDGDAGAVGESMLESMGGKKTGTEYFLGYSCDVWEMPGGKQLIYKGAMLKADISLLGIRTITIATSARFNHNVAESNFELPNFPVQRLESLYSNDFSDEDFEHSEDDEEMSQEALEALSKMSFEEWKKLVLEDDEGDEMKNMSDEELRQMFDYIQKMRMENQ